jgi:hypothetical protein
LEATGDLTQRKSPIGDPKGDFLVRNRDRIVGELRWMIERWKMRGKPLDETVNHPSCSAWAQVLGGILKVNGFTDFLKNQLERRSDDNPVRKSLAILGSSFPETWDPTATWAARIAKLGLTKALIPTADRDTPEGRLRGTGVTLTNHTGETLVIESEDARISLTLERARRRFDGKKPQTRYRFRITESREFQPDAE